MYLALRFTEELLFLHGIICRSHDVIYRFPLSIHDTVDLDVWLPPRLSTSQLGLRSDAGIS
jgi:hypothetical protein